MAFASKIETVAIKPQLTLTFTADKADNSVAFEFLHQKSRGDSRCGVDFNYGGANNARGTAFNSTSGGANGAWTMSDKTATACAAGVQYQYQVADFNNALTHCGWERLERAGETEFQTTVLATSLQQVRGARVVPAQGGR